jgi:outer membrane protein assembly factor BamB
MRTYSLRFLGMVLGFLLIQTSLRAQENWSRFRGPNGIGITALKGVPTEWTPDDYEWSVDLNGKGHSSPVIWGDTLFVTSGEDDGSRILFCLDAITGKVRWSDTLHLDPNHLHKKNCYGSGTPTTDGQRVYAAAADDDHYNVTAYSMKGQKVWSRDLGAFKSQHGFANSPILHDGLLILPNDQDGPSSIVALDAATGEIRWKTPRKVETASYATPMLAHVNGQDQIIVLSGATGLAGLDPVSGREIWTSGALPQRTVASPVLAQGLLIATCGSGGRGQYMAVVNPQTAIKGDVPLQSERKKNLPYVPTPISDGEYLYLWNDDGIVCCVDAREDINKNIWRERVGGNYSGSPVIIDGKIYCISEDGLVKIVATGPQFQEFPGGSLGDPSYSTPAVANGRVYLRSFHRLSCLKAKSKIASKP